METELISQMKKPGEKIWKGRENPEILPELIKYYIADEWRIKDYWKDEIERTLLWPKKVKEVKIEIKEERREKKKRHLWNLQQVKINSSTL